MITFSRWRKAIILTGLISFFVANTHAHLQAAPLTPKRSITKNGITLLWLEQASLPVVSIQVLVRTGAMYDPQDKAGLANMTASLLEEGTVSRSATQISETADFIGARFGASAGQDYTTLRLRVLKKELATGFALLSDVLMHATFDETEVTRIRKHVLGGIRAEKDRPRSIAMRAFQTEIYGAHPYRHAIVGNEASVETISPSDLRAFHQQYYRPNNTIIAIVGDIKEDEAKKLLQDYLGLWERKKMIFPKITPPPARHKKVEQHIEKNLSQATVMLGHLGIRRSSADYYPVLVMNYILGGGGFSSRMMADIRDDRGLVYSIYSRFSTNVLQGYFRVSLQTKGSSVGEAIAAVLQEMDKIKKTPVSTIELEEAKAYLAGSFPLRIDSSNKVARMLMQIEFYDLGLDYFEQHVKAIKAVTKNEVQVVAKKHLNPEHYALIVVGKKSEIDLHNKGNGVSD